MAFQAGFGSHISIDGTDISQYADNKTLDRLREMLETTSFGDTDRTYIAGLRGFTLQASGSWDSAVDAVIHGADDGAVVVWVFGPEGSTSGDVRYTGNCFLDNYSQASTVDGKVTWSASFTIDGAVTRNTF